jgi:hypothetical protein
MNPMLKYTLGRVGIFVGCAVLALVLLPRDMNVLLKLLIALVASAVASFFLLRPWADELAERMSANTRRRRDEKERLRAALAGEDEPSAPPPTEEDRPA